jgi:hypothetical protein
MNTDRQLERFTIHIDQDILDDLQARLKTTRFAPTSTTTTRCTD